MLVARSWYRSRACSQTLASPLESLVLAHAASMLYNTHDLVAWLLASTREISTGNCKLACERYCKRLCLNQTLCLIGVVHGMCIVFVSLFVSASQLQDKPVLPNPFADQDVCVKMSNDLSHWLYERTT